jgi:H/ACA ribonucleoprotein complex subunit 3
VEPSDEHWLGRLHGHAAAGTFLLAATDDGLVRIEPHAGTLSVAATFPDTEGLVDAATELFVAPDAVYAVDGGRIRKLTLN